MEHFVGFEHCVRENEPLAPHTWLRVGGMAEFLAEPTSVEELGKLVVICRENDIPARMLGGGSNLIVRDEGVAGLVILLAAPAFTAITPQGNRIRAGGGAKLGHVVSVAVREGLAGLEQLVGVPGTVGGALHGNVGANGVDIGEWAHAATVMNRSGEIVTYQRDEMRFAYRSSSLDELAILDVELEFESGDTGNLTKRMQKLWIIRKSQQPQTGQDFVAVFKDPSGDTASSLLSQACLEGMRVGEVEISGRDPNFIVTRDGATAADAIRLIELMQDQVHERLGVELEREVEIW